ncbi:MAG: PilN domain-containing protein [Armatimonadota bacterium]
MIDINLIAERQRERRTKERFSRMALATATLFFVLTVVTFAVMQVRVAKKRYEIERIQQQIRQAERKKQDIDAVQEQINRKQPLVGLLYEARDSERLWCMALRDISRSVPDEVRLQSIRSSSTLRPRVKLENSKVQPKGQRGVSIVGVAMQNESVGRFMTNLGNTPSFGDTYLNYTRVQRNRDATVFRFEIIAMLAEPDKEGA